jgi:hypothetical protein
MKKYQYKNLENIIQQQIGELTDPDLFVINQDGSITFDDTPILDNVLVEQPTNPSMYDGKLGLVFVNKVIQEGFEGVGGARYVLLECAIFYFVNGVDQTASNISKNIGDVLESFFELEDCLGVPNITTYIPKNNSQNWRMPEMYKPPLIKDPKQVTRGATVFNVKIVK